MYENIKMVAGGWDDYLNLIENQCADLHQQQFGRPMSKLDRADIIFKEEMLLALAATYCIFFEMAIADGALRKMFGDSLRYYLSQFNAFPPVGLLDVRLNAYKNALDKQGVALGFTMAGFYSSRAVKRSMLSDSVALASYCMMTTSGGAFLQELSQFKVVK